MHESCFYGIIKKTMWFKYQMEVLMTEREKMLAGEYPKQSDLLTNVIKCV